MNYEGGAKLTLAVCRRVMEELEGPEQGEATDTLRNIMEGYVTDSQEQEVNNNVLRTLKNRLAKMDVTDWPDDIEEEFNRMRSETSNNNVQKNIQDHPWIKELGCILNDEEDEPQTEDIDDDLAMTQTEINTVCPISKVEMKKPVRNSACGHVYDKSSIEHILRQRPGSICPVVGCPNKMSVQRDQLKEDKATKRAIARKRNN